MYIVSLVDELITLVFLFPLIIYKYTEQYRNSNPYNDHFVRVEYFTDVDRRDIEAQKPEIQELVQAGEHFGVVLLYWFFHTCFFLTILFLVIVWYFWDIF